MMISVEYRSVITFFFCVIRGDSRHPRTLYYHAVYRIAFRPFDNGERILEKIMECKINKYTSFMYVTFHDLCQYSFANPKGRKVCLYLNSHCLYFIHNSTAYIIIRFQRGIIVILRVTLSAARGRNRLRTQFNGPHHHDVHGPKYWF